MSLAETVRPKSNGHAPPWREAPARAVQKIEDFVRSPSLAIPRPGKPAMKLQTDRVRARPAISPQVSMMIGMTALGLGVWGTAFPKSVRRTLGVKAPTMAIRAVFGAREFWSGYVLTADPTRAEVLWTRVAADLFDIAVLKSLDSDRNPRRGAAKVALGFVLAVTALDVVTAVRMSNVQRNCA